MLVIFRIHRLAQLTDVALRPTFAAAGLAPGDFDVLAALRRTGPPHARTAGQLREALMVTSGAVSKQAGKALITRAVGTDDARVRRSTLTDAGVALVDELIEVHLDNERRLLAGLTAELAAALAVLAADLETDRA